MRGFLSSFLWLLLHVVLAVRDHQAPQVLCVDAHAHLATYFGDEVIMKPLLSDEEQTAKDEFVAIIAGRSDNIHQKEIAQALDDAKDDSSFRSDFRKLSWVAKHRLVLDSIQVLEGAHQTVESKKLADKMKEKILGANIKTAQQTEFNQSQQGLPKGVLNMQDVKGVTAENLQSIEVLGAKQRLDSIQAFEGAGHMVGLKELADVMNVTSPWANIKIAQRTDFKTTLPGIPNLKGLSTEDVTENIAEVMRSIEVQGAKVEIEAFLNNLHTRPLLGKQFRVEHFVGKGQFGLVFKARVAGGQSEVALKLVAFPGKAHLASKEWYVSKHLRENDVRNVVLTHEHVYLSRASASVIKDAAEEHRKNFWGPFICLVQPYMGHFTTLDEFEFTKGKPRGTMVNVMKDAASVLANMHAKLTQHGDIKPDKIMVNEHPPYDVYLIDLGNAQISSKAENFRYDVLRFGWTLFCVVTGRDWNLLTLRSMDPAEIIRLLASQHAYANVLQNIAQRRLQHAGGGGRAVDDKIMIFGVRACSQN